MAALPNCVLYFVLTALSETPGLFSPVPEEVLALLASAYGGLIYITSFFLRSGSFMISCKPLGSLLKGSFRKSNWNTWLSKRLLPSPFGDSSFMRLMRSCMASTSRLSIVDAQMLNLLLSPANRLPVPAQQSHTTYSSCQFSPNSSAKYCCDSSTHFCGVKNEPFLSLTSCGTNKS